MRKGEPLSPTLTVLVTHGNRAIEVRRKDEGRWRTETAVHPEAMRELARLAELETGCLAWFDERLENVLSDVTGWPGLLRHGLEVVHAGSIDRPDLAVSSLGYIDFDSFYFFPPLPARRSPMWFVSAAAGIATAAALRAVRIDASCRNLPTALIDFGGRGHRAGVCAYSEPRLLARAVPADVAAALRTRLSAPDVALLARRLYGRRWMLFWLASTLVFERSLPVLSGAKAWSRSEPSPADDKALGQLAPVLAESEHAATVDVVIPTLGRPESVRDLLADLAAQTHPPRLVAIVEQQPGGRPSDLEALVQEAWPFRVAHRCVNWTGACRARNAGLEDATGDWVVYLDDDVRLTPRFVERALGVARAYGAEVITALVRSPNAPQARDDARRTHFWSGFPTCAAIVSRAAADAVGGFDLRLEGGWGEDFEYGLRLRRTGATVLRMLDEPVLHLHRPSGGFRSPLVRPWDNDAVTPKPSPTVLLSRRELPRPMQQGYRLVYTLKRALSRPWYRLPAEVITALRQWRAGVAWADRLARGN